MEIINDYATSFLDIPVSEEIHYFLNLFYLFF